MILLLGGVGLYFLLNTGEQASENDAVQMQTSGNHEGHEWVDLGLPSGLKWATCNVGAANPEDSGNYYAWGETKTKSSYTDDNKVWEYWSEQGGNTSCDAATANWGGNWRMPTQEECRELIDNCTWTWTSLNGHNGYKVTGPSGQSLFLPAAGYYSNMLRSVGESGGYWSSTHNDGEGGDSAADSMNLAEDYINIGYEYCYFGQSVRPVL